MNSSYNVGRPQLRRIQEEMGRAVRLLREAEIVGETDWKRLLRGSAFFHQHVHFLHITIMATNADDFVPWFRFCESKLRYLINRLDIPDVMAFPFAKFFDRRYNKNGRCLGAGRSDDDCLHESCFFMGLRFAPGLEKVDLQFYTTDFLHMINSWEGRRKGMDLSMAHVVFQDLPGYVFEDQSVITRPSNGDATKRNSSSSSSDRSQTSPSGVEGGISAMPLAPVPLVLSPAKRARKTV
jgi:poly(A) polymerase Pap1